MATYLNQAGLQVVGSINISSFVTLTTSADGKAGAIRQSVAGDYPFGVVPDGSAIFPGSPGFAQIVANATDGVIPQIYNAGDICDIQLGASAVVPGNFLGPDANGNAIPIAAGSGVFFGAIALFPGAAGQIIQVATAGGKA